MQVIREIQFDDSDMAPKGVCYVGVDRQLVRSTEVFYVRSYDDEPSTAIIMEPEEALGSVNSKALVEFLKAEYDYERFLFPCNLTKLYEEIDPESMQFINPKQF